MDRFTTCLIVFALLLSIVVLSSSHRSSSKINFRDTKQNKGESLGKSVLRSLTKKVPQSSNRGRNRATRAVPTSPFLLNFNQSTNSVRNYTFAEEDPCGPYVLDNAVQLDSAMIASRRPSVLEQRLVSALGDWIGYYRTYDFRQEGRFFYNHHVGLRSMAYNVSQQAVYNGNFNTYNISCYEKKIACDINYKQSADPYVAAGVNQPTSPYGTVFDYPNYCARDYRIISIVGTSADDIQQNLYENYNSILLEYRFQVIGAGCALDNVANSIYFCTFIFVQVVYSHPGDMPSGCLCLTTPYQCCPRGLVLSPFDP